MRTGKIGVSNAARSLAMAALLGIASISHGGTQETIPASLQLESLRGKVIYLDFWASWCAPCRKSFPWMQQLQAKFAHDGLVVLAINLDQDRALADAFLRDTSPTFRIAYDPKGELATRFRVQGMPTSLVIGRDGQVVATHQGFKEKRESDYEDHVRRALAL